MGSLRYHETNLVVFETPFLLVACLHPILFPHAHHCIIISYPMLYNWFLLLYLMTEYLLSVVFIEYSQAFTYPIICYCCSYG